MEKKNDGQLRHLTNLFTNIMGENGFDCEKRLIVAGYLATRDNKFIDDLAKIVAGSRTSLILQYAEDLLKYAKDLSDPVWEVTIRETLEKKVVVKAPSRTAAMEIAKNGFDEGDYEFVLDESYDFKCVDFDVKEQTPSENK